MAEKTFRPIQTSKHDVKVLYAKLTGGGAAANLTVNGTGGQVPTDIVSATYSSTGTFTIVFRDKYYRLMEAPTFSFVGTNPGMQGKCTAIDVQAGTATFLISYSTTPTDPETTDSIYVKWSVSNSSLGQ